MQERHHVKTTPNEPKAPEIVAHPVRKEPGGNVQTDDINIPLVAIFVAFFGVLLAVVIISLQAWFYNVDAAERAAKTKSQEDASTDLGRMLDGQRTQLHKAGTNFDAAGNPITTQPSTTATASTASRPTPHRHMTIDNAMADVVARYAQGASAK